MLIIAVLLTTLLCVVSCSTTKNLPAGEILYTGIEKIIYRDIDSIQPDDDLLTAIENALECTPNNAFLGSSRVRTPIPTGLWIYNANVNKKGKLNQWFMKWLAAKPVLISSVKPDTRVKIAQNILRDHGYFAGISDYEIIPDKKDSLKAKVSYGITFGEPYILDSIEYNRVLYRTDTLLKLDESERLIKKGDIFNTATLEDERQRIASLMRDNGYYYFRPEYIVYQADSTLEERKISLKTGLKQGIMRSIMRPWKIGDISFYINGYDNERPTDSLIYKDLKLFYADRLRVRPKVLYNRLQFSKGELYSLQKQTDTQTAINMLDIFRFTKIQYSPVDTTRTCDTMNVRISASLDYPVNGTFEIGATANDNNYAGPGIELNLTQRNFFGGGEVLTASLFGSYEWYTGRALRENTGLINNYEIGVKSGITFPQLILPPFMDKSYDFNASTHLNFDLSLLNRARYYNMLTVSSGLSYEFFPSPIRHHLFTPFKLIFNKLQNATHRFDSIVEYNPSLAQSLQNQFIPVIEYTYTLDNSSRREDRSKTWWRFSISEAGNIVSGVYAAFGKGFTEQKKILGNPYAQFLKATTELRYNHYLNRDHRLVSRIGGGIIYSYGNSTVAPYNERFYVGGANSIRAFTIRSVGPGRFTPDPDNPYAYIDQNGDVKIEGNLEYRGRLVGDLDIAVFIDAGNVWLLRDDPTRPGGRFDVRHLLNDIALGTGLGFRYDMDMMVFRLDIGYALHFPCDTGRRGYFNTPSFADGIGLHLALGYPF